MKKTLLLLSIFYCNLTPTLFAHIVIREAIQEDLPALFEFDRTISYEYFLPLYSTGYSHLPIGKDPEYYLALELEYEKQWFQECINGTAESLWIAYDQLHHTIAGLIIAHQESRHTMEIDLLFVAQEYRGKGIGKILIHHAIEEFPKIVTCEVYPLKFANDPTLTFYQAVGFINQGEPADDKVNLHGIPYKDMYFHFTYTMQSRFSGIDSEIIPIRRTYSAHIKGIR